MHPFTFERSSTVADAIIRGGASGATFVAGGTTLVDLMKLDVETPSTLVDINRLPLDAIEVAADGSIRVVDYKLSRLPDADSSIQIAAYAHAARVLLDRSATTPHRIGAAMYLAFGDEDEFEGALGNRNPYSTKTVFRDRSPSYIPPICGIVACDSSTTSSSPRPS